MASVKYKGTGTITSADFHTIKYEGVTKEGKAVVITLNQAINKGNIDWTFAEKGETVANVTFEGCYENTDAMSSSNDEPWTIEMETSTNAAGCIILGVGKFYVDNNVIALTRGGGQFQTGRTVRDIGADGDRGTVVDRVTMDEARPTLSLNALTIINSFTDLYPAVAVTQ